MSTTVTLPEDRDARVPLVRLVQVEMRKMLDTRAGFWLILVIVLLTAALMILVAIFAPDEVRTFDGFLGVASTPQGFLLPVLGVLLVTSEWGQRAALTTFTLVPVRIRVVVAKLLAALAIGLGVMVVAVVLAALVTLVRGGSDPWSGGTDPVSGGPAGSVGDALWKFAVLQVLGIVKGVGFGMLFLNSAAAIVTFFVLPFASALVFGLLPQLDKVGPWLDVGTAGQVLTAAQLPSVTEWGQVATSSALWIVAPLVIGGLRILRSEVK